MSGRRSVQIMIVSTEHPSIRDEVFGWSHEWPALIERGKPIGLTPSWSRGHRPHPSTVLEAIADGWRLLGPPVRESGYSDDGTAWEHYDWWLTRDVEAPV